MNKKLFYTWDFRCERGDVVIEGRLEVKGISLEDAFDLRDLVLEECFENHGYDVTDTGAMLNQLGAEEGQL